jgi:hypothetical protein
MKTLDRKFETKKESELKKCQKLTEDIKSLAQMAARV